MGTVAAPESQIRSPLLAARRAAAGALAGTGSLSLWTYAVSVCLHAAVLLPLALVSPGTAAPRAADPVTPTAKVEAVRNSLKESTLLPKPRVISAAAAASVSPALPEVSREAAAAPRQNEAIKPIVRESQPDSRQSASARPRYVAPQVEFFGSRLGERKVCFVVDASGSMLALFPTVRSHLADSVQGLQADQYFNIIFFNSKLYESTPGTLTRASSSARTAAISFISSVQSAGSTNPLAAIERAMRCRDASGDAPAVIYFLTDGFDLAPSATDDLPAAIESLRKRLAPAVKINTIGFMTQPHDSSVLQKLAKQTGGEYVSVTN
jgi:Mg-chelatase subunit ChlD